MEPISEKYGILISMFIHFKNINSRVYCYYPDEAHSRPEIWYEIRLCWKQMKKLFKLSNHCNLIQY